MVWHRGSKGAWQDLVYRASQAQGDLGETQLGFAGAGEIRHLEGFSDIAVGVQC